MTISQILGYSTEELEAKSDAELYALLNEHFVYTRPETSVPVVAKTKKVKTVVSDGVEKPKRVKKISEDQAIKNEALALLQSILNK